MPARGKAVLEVSFGPAATLVLPRAVAFAAHHADHGPEWAEACPRPPSLFLYVGEEGIDVRAPDHVPPEWISRWGPEEA